MASLTLNMLPRALLVLLVCEAGVHAICRSTDQVECLTTGQCIRTVYLCDGDNDCDDYSDEDSDLCNLWRDYRCNRGDALCTTSSGATMCVSMQTYCNLTATNPCHGDVDPRICQMLYDVKIQTISEIVLSTTANIPPVSSTTATILPALSTTANILPVPSITESILPASSTTANILSVSSTTASILPALSTTPTTVPSVNQTNSAIMISENVTTTPENTGYQYENDLVRSIIKGEDFIANLKHTLKDNDCPQFYTKLGNDCLSFFYIGSVSWGEARSFCKTIGGDLFIPDDITVFSNLTRHMKKYMTTDFWMGGNYNDSTGWQWINGKPIEMGTLQWGPRYTGWCSTREVFLENRNTTILANNGYCYNYGKTPEKNPTGRCVASTYEKFFFLTDEDCVKTMSPLCKLIR